MTRVFYIFNNPKLKRKTPVCMCLFIPNLLMLAAIACDKQLYAAGFHLIPCFFPPDPYIVAIAIVPLTYYCIVTKEHPLRKKYPLWFYRVKV